MRRLHLVQKKKSFIVKFTCSVRLSKKSAHPAALADARKSDRGSWSSASIYT